MRDKLGYVNPQLHLFCGTIKRIVETLTMTPRDIHTVIKFLEGLALS